MRRLLYISVMLVALVVLPEVASSQISASDIARAQQRGEQVSLGGESTYGNFAEGDEGSQNGMMEDSTRTARIRKPLESYYFSDTVRALPNFLWNVDRDMNEVYVQPLDTTLMNWRIDYPYFLKGVGDMTMGGLGQSTLPFNYKLR